MSLLITLARVATRAVALSLLALAALATPAPALSLPPTQPTNVSAEAVLADSARVTWGVSTDPDGSVIGYEVSVNGSDPQFTTGTSLDLTGLSPDTEYFVSVRARFEDGSLSAPASSFFTTQAVAQPPSPPWNVTWPDPCLPVISWGPSVDLDGEVVAYEVRYDAITVTVSGTQTSATLAEIDPDTTYTLTVVAIDDTGARSQPSAELTVTTPAHCETGGAPTQVGPITVSAVTPVGATLSFAPGPVPFGNRPPVAFDVFQSPEPAAALFASAGEPPITITGLSPATSHTLYVRARDAAGRRGPARSVSFTTAPTEYRLSGALTIPSLLRTSAPLDAELQFDGKSVLAVTIRPARARLKPFGLLPLTADLAVIPSSAPSGGFEPTGDVTISLQAKLRITNAYLFGAVPVAGLGTCQNKRVSTITLSGPTPSQLEASFGISDLTGCGTLNGVTSPLTASEGNSITLYPPPLPPAAS